MENTIKTPETPNHSYFAGKRDGVEAASRLVAYWLATGESIRRLAVDFDSRQPYLLDRFPRANPEWLNFDGDYERGFDDGVFEVIREDIEAAKNSQKIR